MFFLVFISCLTPIMQYKVKFLTNEVGEFNNKLVKKNLKKKSEKKILHQLLYKFNKKNKLSSPGLFIEFKNL